MCGTEARIDCTKQFGRKKCDPDSDMFEKCVGAGDQCNVYSSQDSCKGSTIVYCDDGFIEETDCTSLGFSGCEPLKVGAMEIGALCK